MTNSDHELGVAFVFFPDWWNLSGLGLYVVMAVFPQLIEEVA